MKERCFAEFLGRSHKQNQLLMEEDIVQIQFGVRGCFELIAPICRVVWKVLKCPLVEIGSPDGDLRIPLICWASRWQNSTQGRGIRLFK